MTDLLNQAHNLLPHEGEVYYLGQVMSQAQATQYFDHLHTEIDWQADEAIMFGRKIKTRRKVAWHGDAPYSYTYSRSTKQALPWTPALLELKVLCERLSQARFNACLLNLYHDGEDGMAWHSDGERDLKRHASIASLSLGAQRRFGFKHKASGETVYLELQPGSLLLMRGETQDYWRHRLPPTKKIHSPRINLTFRMMNSSLRTF